MAALRAALHKLAGERLGRPGRSAPALSPARITAQSKAMARQAAVADVQVTHDITPGYRRLPGLLPVLDEAAAALDRAGQLLSAHLASAERVTA